MLEQLIAIVGALIGLAFFDYRIALSCSVVIVPLLVINNIYSKRVAALQATYHDSIEDTYEVFATHDHDQVRAYYETLARPQQRIANWGAVSFGLMRVVLLGVFLVVLYISIDLDNFTTGSIYSL